MDNDEKHEYMNGNVLPALPPDRPMLHEPERLGPHAGWPELSAAYATVSLQQVPHFKGIYDQLDSHHGAINHLGRLQFEHGRIQVEHGEKLDRILVLLNDEASAYKHLPPMRDRRQSNIEIVEDITPKIAERLERRASETPGPGVGDSPQEVTSIVKELLEAELAARSERDRRAHEQAELERYRAEEAARIEDAKRTKVRAEAKAREDAEETRKEVARRKRELRTTVIKWVASVSGALATAFVIWLASHADVDAKVRSEGDRRFREGQQSAPPVAFVAVPPEAVSAIATGSHAPATAPAMVAPPPRK
ncbi:MAG: hypothetical protein ACHREM_16680 [Polyangiales bacterium]